MSARLTTPERTILRSLPTNPSDADIGAELYLSSVNTVKTHVRSVYRKLGVD